MSEQLVHHAFLRWVIKRSVQESRKTTRELVELVESMLITTSPMEIRKEIRILRAEDILTLDDDLRIIIPSSNIKIESPPSEVLVDISIWGHIQCSSCTQWFAMENQSKLSCFCAHCGIPLKLKYLEVTDELQN